MNRERTVEGLFFGALLLAFGYLAALVFLPFLTYLLAAFLLAFLFTPLQRRLSDRLSDRLSSGTSTKLSALGLVFGAVGATGVVVVLMALALPADAEDISRALQAVVGNTRFERRVESTLAVDVPLQSVLGDVPRRIADLVVGDLSAIVDATTHAFLGLVLLLFLFYYLLQDGDRLVAWVADRAPLDDETTDEILEEAGETTWAVLKGHVFIAVVQGVVAGFGLFVVGLPHVVFWTVVMMFLELFPVVGVAGVLGPAVLYLVVTDRLLAAGFLLVYGLTAVAVVDDYLRAYVVDRESSLHSAVVLVGVFGGVYAFGVMGLFYGPVVLGLFRTVVRLFDEEYAPGA
jgi:predicted PurR-regulated permease PerM